MAPTPAQLQLIRDYEPALFFVGTPGAAGAERFFPSDAKRYLEHCALWRARAPFSNRTDWGAPVVESGEVGAVDGEAAVFIGQRDGAGTPLYLKTPPDLECFLEPSGWSPDDQYANLTRLAARYASEPELKESQFWYHAEFFDADRLRRLFSHAVDPDGVVTDFNALLRPQSTFLTDPALICYYLFYPGHDEALGGCVDPYTGMLYDKAREFGSFAGEWSCIAILLDRANPATPYTPKWAGLTNRNIGVVQVAGREVRLGMRILPWSAMQTFEGNHPRFTVALGNHALYLPGETPPPVQPLTSNDPSTAFCGSATALVDPLTVPTTVGAALGTEIVIGKMIAGSAAGFGVFGPIGSAVGAIGGAIWGVAEATTPSLNPGGFGTYIPLGVPAPAPPVDTIATAGFVVHPKGKRPAEVDPNRATEWRSADNIIIGGRRYDSTVDRQTQFLWGDDVDGQGYTGRWGPDVAEDAQRRRAGMKFPKFWQMFFDDLVRHDPPSRTIVLTRESGSSWVVPNDWNNANNSIACIGAGGGGAGGVRSVNAGGGGGGGEFRLAANQAMTAGGIIPFSVGLGGEGGAAASDGAAGGETAFNVATLVAKGGAKGVSSVSPGIGGAGGTGGSGGTVSFPGGAGGSGQANWGAAPGGGGAAGPNGAGASAESTIASGPATSGGVGDNKLGGAGGAAGRDEANGPIAGGSGDNGAEIAGGVGAGGGGGGGYNSGASSAGGTGGKFGGGGGGGGANANGQSAGGRGADGVIVITYTP